MADPEIAFPDAVEVLNTLIRSAVDPVHVGARTPNPRPSKFIRTTRTGGPRRDLVTDQPTLVIEAWAEQLVDAIDLASTARTAVLAGRGQTVAGVQLYAVREMSGPADMPDPDSHQERVRFTVQLDLRGAPPAP